MPRSHPVGDSLRWTIYCRVIDNLGDAGVCWRLAADLANRGHRVRLVIDDAAPLRLLAPQGADRVEVQRWPGTALAEEDVVIEAFGCDPPAEIIAAMAARPSPPLWIDLEYLSAEPWVERSHGLPSPQVNGLTRWFFFPGFGEGTGGLLRERGLIEARNRFDARAWLQGRGIAADDGRIHVSLFCYENGALPDLLDALARLGERPVTLLLTQGHAQRQVAALQSSGRLPPSVRCVPLPWLTQADFDHLLWSCELNIVRGEDSLVRAIWAGTPFIWQAYPLQGGAQQAKVDAMLQMLAAGESMAQAWRAWNGSVAPGSGLKGLQDLSSWRAGVELARDRLLARTDLVTRLVEFAHARIRPPAQGCGLPRCSSR